MSRIINTKSVEKFSPDPYIISVINCGSWVAYAIVTPDRQAPLITNLIGTAVNIIYVLVFAFNNPIQPDFRRKVFGASVFMAAVLTIVFLVIPNAGDWGKSDAKVESSVLGTVSDVFNVLMYAGPLTIMSTVIKTKSVEYMPLALTIGTSFCSFTWLWYGFVVKDPYIIIPNGGGALLCVCQIILYTTYCNTAETKAAREKYQERKSLGRGSLGPLSQFNEDEKKEATQKLIV
eukprot:CAMPEP_0182499928 /NCGR_PEP_ID=MMETSP1321-20130603/8028_1 /TAXON_ID=91990 /ORGANISM="Bolidomonas sp., Strain RCC1657" /LENGTH=232 /DNA_ID=CAMNT_0024704183 /DNA_START=94 /DNA_END=792 /DNA_ORIENTATION=+